MIELVLAGVTQNTKDFIGGELLFPSIYPVTLIKEEGLPMKVMTIRIPDEKHERLRQLARKRDMSINDKIFLR